MLPPKNKMYCLPAAAAARDIWVVKRWYEIRLPSPHSKYAKRFNQWKKFCSLSVAPGWGAENAGQDMENQNCQEWNTQDHGCDGGQVISWFRGLSSRPILRLFPVGVLAFVNFLSILCCLSAATSSRPLCRHLTSVKLRLSHKYLTLSNDVSWKFQLWKFHKFCEIFHGKI